MSTQPERTQSPWPSSPEPDDEPAAADLCSWGITTIASAAGRITVLWIAGEVDLFTLPILRAALADGLQRQHDCLVLDLSQLTFCGVSGLTMFELAATTAAERGADYLVSGCPASLERLWSLLLDADLPTRHATVTDAVTAAWATLPR